MIYLSKKRYIMIYNKIKLIIIGIILTIPFILLAVSSTMARYASPSPILYAPWQHTGEPDIKVRLIPRYPEGYRLRVNLKNIRMSEICTKQEAMKPVGHVHLYINDVLYGMLFESETDLPPEALVAGKNKILVTLQSPDHRVITVNDDAVYDSLEFNADISENSVKKYNSGIQMDLHHGTSKGMKSY